MIKDIKECRAYMGYKHLTKRGKAVYIAVCNQLLQAGEIPPVYLDQLTMYAHRYDDFLNMDEVVKREGYTLEWTDKQGNTKLYANPAVKIRREALHDVIRIGKNFGFSTLDKTRVPMPDGPDPLEQFLAELNREYD